MAYDFGADKVVLEQLKKKAFNLRWAEVEDGTIPLTAADPDYPVADVIRQAIIDYARDGYFSYTPNLGLAEFRQALSSALLSRKGEEIDPSMILPIDSAARGMAVIAQAFLRPGDEMIVFDPCDFLFREACLSAGGTPVSFRVTMDPVRRRMDLSGLESAVTDKTRMIGLCNPHNPYGLLYSREDLEMIMEIAERHDLLILNDEIWSDIIYPEEPFRSIYCLGSERCRRVISVFGFSKSFGLAGLRIGAVYATDRDNFEKVVGASAVLTTQGGATSISQVAAAAALNGAYPWLDEFMVHLTGNRDFAVDYISREIPRLKAYRPKATYLLYVDISDLGMISADFTSYLREKHKLAIVPGGHRYFGDESEGHARICIATSREILQEGLRRLKEGVEALK